MPSLANELMAGLVRSRIATTKFPVPQLHGCHMFLYYEVVSYILGELGYGFEVSTGNQKSEKHRSQGTKGGSEEDRLEILPKWLSSYHGEYE